MKNFVLRPFCVPTTCRKNVTLSISIQPHPIRLFKNVFQSVDFSRNWTMTETAHTAAHFSIPVIAQDVSSVATVQ